jgi:hypothetical protein
VHDSAVVTVSPRANSNWPNSAASALISALNIQTPRTKADHEKHAPQEIPLGYERKGKKDKNIEQNTKSFDRFKAPLLEASNKYF